VSVEVLPAHHVYTFGISFGFDEVAVLRMGELGGDGTMIITPIELDKSEVRQD
jgi:hypothetical protein